jgi:rhodanese-related sulfurtransferase
MRSAAARRIQDVINVIDGFDAWSKAGLPVVAQEMIAG